MKTIIAASILALSTAANADDFGWMRNNAGGKIIITEEPCPIKELNKNSQKAMAYNQDGDIALGCWGRFKHDDSKILIYWQDSNETKIYDITDFTYEIKKNGTQL